MNISRNFIVGLRKEGNKSIIMVVVDRLSKYGYFYALQHAFIVVILSHVFLDQIFNLHGNPTFIVSDRDHTFTNKFWQELIKLKGTQLKIAIAYHPQTGG